jgi:hypothetical protein
MGHKFDFTLDYSGTGLVPGTEITLAKDILLTYTDSTGSLITYELDPIKVKVNPSRIQGKIKLDKYSYGMDEDVIIDILVENFIMPVRLVHGTVEIIDKDNAVIKVLDDTLAITDTFDKNYKWNTEDYISGPYAVRLRLYDGSNLACEVIEPFVIRPEGGFKNNIRAAKPVYDPETVAVFYDRVENSYKNYYAGRITDTITVYDSVGNILFTQVFDLGNMFDPYRDVTAYWSIGRVLPGTYRAEAVVREDGIIVTKSECTIEVTTHNSTDIRGALDIPVKIVKLGEDVDMNYSLENLGTRDIDGADALITVLDPKSLHVVYQETAPYDMPVGEPQYGDLTVVGRLLDVGDYIALYSVIADGVVYPMQSDGFTVQDDGNDEKDIRGTLDIPKKTVYVGEDVIINYTLENISLSDINVANSHITVLNSNSQMIYQDRATYALPVGKSDGGRITVPASLLAVGNYSVTYNVEAGGTVYPMPGGTFAVIVRGGSGNGSSGTSNIEPIPAVTLDPDEVPGGSAETDNANLADKMYKIECIDKVTDEIIYSIVKDWDGSEVFYVFAPILKGWILADNQADFQEVLGDSIPLVVRFYYVADVEGEHLHYLLGYPDNTMRPDRNITRAEAAAIMYRLIKDPDKAARKPARNKFNDVEGHWAETEIEYIGLLGLIAGYPNGEYRPENEISREELITIFVRYANTQPEVIVDTGVEGWSSDYINIAVSNGYIVGYANGDLRLNDYMTRAQAVTMMNRIFNRAFDKDAIDEQMLPHSDMSRDHWAYEEIIEGTITHKYRRVNSLEELIR